MSKTTTTTTTTIPLTKECSLCNNFCEDFHECEKCTIVPHPDAFTSELSVLQHQEKDIICKECIENGYDYFNMGSEDSTLKLKPICLLCEKIMCYMCSNIFEHINDNTNDPYSDNLAVYCHDCIYYISKK
jgi:hypothetical protein